jgi:hypothetical protein
MVNVAREPTFIPAFDYLARAKAKAERLTPIPGAIEHFPIRELPRVVDDDGLSLCRKGALAFFDNLDLHA